MSVEDLAPERRYGSGATRRSRPSTSAPARRESRPRSAVRKAGPVARVGQKRQIVRPASSSVRHAANAAVRVALDASADRSRQLERRHRRSRASHPDQGFFAGAAAGAAGRLRGRAGASAGAFTISLNLSTIAVVTSIDSEREGHAARSIARARG